MAIFSNARVYHGLQITGTPTKTNVANDVLVGVSSTGTSIAGNVAGFSVSGFIGGAAGSLNISSATGLASLVTTPTAQVETATAAGTISTSGNATVIVTGARITGSPVTVSVPVLSGDTAATWAVKVRTALAANTAISSVYTVSGSTTAIVLTETVAGYDNDGDLNISLDNGTCAGITTAATSADTVEGVAGEIIYNNTGDGNDCEGIPLGPLVSVKSILVKCSQGSVTLTTVDDPWIYAEVTSGGHADIYSPAGKSPNSIGALNISANEAGSKFEVTVIGTTA